MKMPRPILTLTATALGALALFAADAADARRGGSFGSRGMRTYSAPPRTRSAPVQTAPVQRSMTPQQPGMRPASGAARANPVRSQPRSGIFSNPLVRGLLLGGVLGALLGFGFGGSSGMMASLLQVLAFALSGLVLFKLFAGRRREQPAAGYAGPSVIPPVHEMQQPAEPNRYFNLGGGSAPLPESAAPSDEIGVLQADLDAFEALLIQVQTAFGAEDYGALRAITTPEIMSYLSEELSQNATQGRRNEVSDVRLEQGDLAEAWREGDTDYATVAMRYSSRDVMRDRASGQMISGDAEGPTQTVELWTFVRSNDQPWKLSAIQEA